MKKGMRHTKEARRRISEAGKGRTVSLETRKKLSEAGKGRIFSKESRQKMSRSHTGRKFSEEHRQNISIANKGNPKPKLSTALKGRKLSKEHILNRTIAQMKCRTDGYCDAWSDKEYKEDLRNDICSDCGMTESESLEKWDQRLALHHKDGNKQDCNPDNFCTLCRSCHAYADWELRKGVKYVSN